MAHVDAILREREGGGLETEEILESWDSWAREKEFGRPAQVATNGICWCLFGSEIRKESSTVSRRPHHMSSKRDTVYTTASRRQGQSKRPGGFSIKKLYLFAYNALSTTGWAYVLYVTVSHILGATSAPPINPTASETARNTIQRLIAKIPLTLRNATPLTQAKTLYSVVGLKVALVQSFAVLEVVHVLLGLVRSPLATTAMQVASRLTLVWGIVENFAETRTNPIYASMVTAWSIAEIIRYTFYALSLLGYEPYVMQYIRYTAFWVNYPVGASSEAFLMLSTVPPLATLFSRSWTATEYTRLALFVSWWPGLYVMMSHMARQRRKVLNKHKTQ